ncbi:SRPBCC family protein [Micromonospora sp. NPDC049151]|uniref:SRPBCC family protein n=1 Tax=unclassified Micromonospora TaxID=2617518 RepID=UPI0033EFA13D
MIRVTTTPVQVRETATVDLPTSAEAAFDFMWDPASSVVLHDSVELGVTLPGPKGVGEIQAFVRRTPMGRMGDILEVVEMEPGRRAVTRTLMAACPGGAELTVVPLGPDSCRLTQALWVELPAGMPVGTGARVRHEYRTHLADLTRGLAAWAAHAPRVAGP